MTANLKPYSKYKHSELKWLDSIPENWLEKRAKYFYREVDERSTTGDETLMSVSHKTGVTPRKENVTMFKAESNIGYKICRPGDIVVNTMWAWMAAMGVADQIGLVSPSYGVYRPIDTSFYISDYVDHLIRTLPYMAEYKCNSTGIRPSRLRLYPEKFLRIPIVCPPVDDQKAMVSFINYQNQLIRRYIRNRRQLIEVLNEQKQAIINQVVTRGLDPNVSLKPSGVDWLGDIPEHWEVKRAKYILKEVDQRSKDGSEQLLRVSQFTGITPRSSNDMTGMPLAESLEGYKQVDIDDLVINIMIAWNGSLGVSRFSGVVSPAYCVYRFTPNIHPWYYHHLLRIPTYRRKIKAESTGVIESRLRLYSDDLGRIELLVPSLEEQSRISDFIAQNTQEIDIIISKTQREIELIREYRTRLITDVVTGKLDVRHFELGEAQIKELVEEDIAEDFTDEDMLDDDSYDSVEVSDNELD